jgi:hypothetical protein
MSAMTAGTLLRAAARSFASNKSAGLAVAAQQVRPRANDSRIGRSAASARYFPAIALSGVAVPRDRASAHLDASAPSHGARPIATDRD